MTGSLPASGRIGFARFARGEARLASGLKRASCPSATVAAPSWGLNVLCSSNTRPVFSCSNPVSCCISAAQRESSAGPCPSHAQNVQAKLWALCAVRSSTADISIYTRVLGIWQCCEASEESGGSEFGISAAKSTCTT